MHERVILAALFLSSCTTPPQPAPEVIPVRGATPGYTCRLDGLERFVGQPANADIAAEIQRTSGARSVRWTGQGMAVTMDFREDRVNVQLDERMAKIVRITCG
jgi:hypothetical protein